MKKLPMSPLSSKASMESGSAVKDCMRALNPAPAESLKAEATLIKDDSPRHLGSVGLTFYWPNFTDYPKVICDTDMRGFGIPHDNFNPDFDIFTFENAGMKLSVVSGEYRFTLLGIRLV
jgi:hypothetical protein